MAYQRHSALRFGLYAIFAVEEFPFPNAPILLIFLPSSKYWNVRERKGKGLILKSDESKCYT